MAKALERDYGIIITWIEDKAENTYQNALYSAAILHANNVSRVIVVTQAWHLPRALSALPQVGIAAAPALGWPLFRGWTNKFQVREPAELQISLRRMWRIISLRRLLITN